MKKVTTLVAAFALAINLVAPVASAAEISLEISGNGADSNNGSIVSSTNETAVVQSNSASINNSVSAHSNSGGNSASRNTGGEVSVDTGDSKTLVAIQNSANTNTADVANCGTCGRGADVKISGNGVDSNNLVELKLEDKTQLAQTNSGSIVNAVSAGSNTGENKANSNTGGDVTVTTGSALTHVDLETEANSNWARIGGNSSHSAGDVTLSIMGNGADSRNKILLGLDRDVILQQYNTASVANLVDAYSNSGDNKANRNTGGYVSIDTGNAHTGVAVDNAANFNWADVDCDCLSDISGKIATNGVESENLLKAYVDDTLNVFQDNSCGDFYAFWDYNGCGIDNGIHAGSSTGDNYAKSNTAHNYADPEIVTGNSETLVGLENAGNSNVFGASSMPTLPLGNGVNINVSFSLMDLIRALGLN